MYLSGNKGKWLHETQQKNEMGTKKKSKNNSSILEELNRSQFGKHGAASTAVSLAVKSFQSIFYDLGQRENWGSESSVSA